MPVPSDTSWLPIANSALVMVGTRLISTVADQSKESMLIQQYWDICRRFTLRAGLWKFAKQYAQLTADPAYTAKFGFNSRYPLPADFIRMVNFNELKGNADESGAPYRIVQGYVYTFMSYANLTYIFDAYDVSRWDPMFSEAMSACLYTKTCKSLTGTDADPKVLKAVMNQARFVDSVEDPSEQLDIDVWLQSRFGTPGLFRDPTFSAETTPSFP